MLAAFLLGWSAGAACLILGAAPEPPPSPTLVAVTVTPAPAGHPVHSAIHEARAVTAEQRKALFVNAVLPLILIANEDVLDDRRHLLRLRAQQRTGGPLAPAEQAWLSGLARHYGVARFTADAAGIEALLERVDAVPPSLALAQAAEESGCGSSHPARFGNALFGQFTWEAGQPPRLRRFDHPLDSVRAYVLNLNTHAAYADFRSARAAQRRAGRDLDGYSLADGLLRYSERGRDYVAAVRTLIRTNGLDGFDRFPSFRHEELHAEPAPAAVRGG